MIAALCRLSTIALTALALTLAPAVASYSEAAAKTAATASVPAKSKAVKKKPAKKPAAAVNTVAQNGYLAAHYSSIVVDADTGHVLSDAEADSPSHPASLTKMMTLYMLFGALERGEVRMTTKLKASAYSAKQSPSKLGIQKGKTLTLDQAIDAIVTLSANDVAVMIGERLGGTEEHFADMMTTTAHRIGMSSTVFVNASGLPNPNQITTARDMAVLGKRLMTDFPQYYPLFARIDFVYGPRKIHTHNHLIDPALPLYYEGADGIKTGYTAASGFNLVSSAKRGGKRLIAVVMGGASSYQRDRHMADLMDDGFEILSGHPERAVAAKRLDGFQATQVAAVPKDEAEAEASAGDKEEPYTTAVSVKNPTIRREALPAAPPSGEVAVPAPALKTMPVPKQQTLAQHSDDTAVSLPIPGGQEVARDAGARSEARAAAPKPAKETRMAALPPAPSSALGATPAKGWGIQVGAFSSAAAAQEQAEAAVAKLKSSFAAATAVVERVAVSGKAMYRARVHGLPETDLVRACAIVGKAARGSCQAVPPKAQSAAG